MTLADVFVAIALIHPLQTVLDGGFRKAMKDVSTWAEKIFGTSEFKNVMGSIKMCERPLKPVCIASPVDKKVEKKAAAPAAKPKEEKKQEKVVDNVQALPPTPFDVYDFKTLFVNHKDKKGAGVDTWYKMLDWDGWSFWHFHYDIYEGEGDKFHVCNNLLTGFLSRAEHTSKYTFARMAVLGEEGSLQIKGCWLLRGQVLPDGLAKEHPQMEYYKTRKLDPRKIKADDTIIR